MAWEKHTAIKDLPPAEISLNGHGRVTLLKSASEQFYGGESHCVTYYDPQQKRIGLEFTNEAEAEGALPVSTPRGLPVINVSTLLKARKINVLNAVKRTVTKEHCLLVFAVYDPTTDKYPPGDSPYREPAKQSVRDAIDWLSPTVKAVLEAAVDNFRVQRDGQFSLLRIDGRYSVSPDILPESDDRLVAIVERIGALWYGKPTGGKRRTPLAFLSK